jgi:hypothetical protein
VETGRRTLMEAGDTMRLEGPRRSQKN